MCAGETVLVFPKEATDAAVIATVTKFHNLKLVNLCGCFKVTDAGVQALAKHHPSLESVNLWCCSEVTDAGVQALAKHCPDLESVNLACCFKVTDVGVQALAENPSLESVTCGVLLQGDPGRAERARHYAKRSEQVKRTKPGF